MCVVYMYENIYVLAKATKRRKNLLNTIGLDNPGTQTKHGQPRCTRPMFCLIIDIRKWRTYIISKYC